MIPENFNHILKHVSRSFYLSMRILPKDMRQPVAIAYLLARAADTMADSDEMDNALREKYLEKLLDELTNDDSIRTESTIQSTTQSTIQSTIKSLSKSLSPLISDSGEKKLIQKLPEIIHFYHTLSAEDKTQVHDVVKTLVSGMQMDLNSFHDKQKIIALKDQHTLEKYIYLVAGCVGEFWTKSAITHLPAVSHWSSLSSSHMHSTLNMPAQTQLGIEFGKALQLTNILRDIAKDAKLGRCYLPNEALQSQQLTTTMLLDKQNDDLFRPLIFQQLNLALTYFESAEAYLFNTPRTEIRLRLGSIWPILIGLKTLELIANKKNFLDSNKNIKVQRKWVYSMLLRSVLIVNSNILLKYWITHIKKNIRQRMLQVK